MKRQLATLVGLLLVTVLGTKAQVNITLVDKVNPTDEMFIDMAVTAAQTSVDDGGMACGAVVILNGAWRSTGRATASQTAEEAAIAKSRLKSLDNATIYTVNEPTTAALNAIAKAGGTKVVFANSRSDVMRAGLYSESDYDSAALADGVAEQVEMVQLLYHPASTLISKQR